MPLLITFKYTGNREEMASLLKKEQTIRIVAAVKIVAAVRRMTNLRRILSQKILQSKSLDPKPKTLRAKERNNLRNIQKLLAKITQNFRVLTL